MTNRTVATIAWLLLCGASSAAECRLDHAGYVEPISGATLQFHPKNTSEDATLTAGLFDLHLPNIKQRFAGDITWNAGNNARPDGVIAAGCTAEQRVEDANACRLWSGSVYSVSDSVVGLLEDADMAAPQSMLLVDFGRVILMREAFVRANPQAYAFDLFTLSSCAS